jgi:hypothetical protein
MGRIKRMMVRKIFAILPYLSYPPYLVKIDRMGRIRGRVRNGSITFLK